MEVDYQKKIEEYLEEKKYIGKIPETRLTVNSLEDLNVNHPALYTELFIKTDESLDNVNLAVFRNVEKVSINHVCKSMPDLSGLKSIRDLSVFIPIDQDHLSAINMDNIEKLFIVLKPDFGRLTIVAPNLSSLDISINNYEEENDAENHIDLSGVPNVKNLKITQTEGVDICSIRNLNKLETFFLRDHSGRSLDEIGLPSSLKVLNIDGTIRDLHGIENLNNLEKLTVYFGITRPLEQNDIDIVNSLPNLKYLYLHEEPRNQALIIREDIKAVISDRDRDFQEIERKVEGIIYKVVDQIQMEDARNIDNFPDFRKKWILEDREVPFMDRVRDRIQQFCQGTYWSINPYNNYFRAQFDDSYVEKYFEYSQQIYPFIHITDEVKQHFEYTKQLSFENEHVKNGIFFSTEKDIYLISSAVKLGSGNIEIRTSDRYWRKELFSQKLFEQWNQVIDEPYDDLDIRVQIFPKYSGSIEIEELIIPTLITLYFATQKIYIGKGIGLVGKFKKDGTLKKAYPLGNSFRAFHTVAAKRILTYGRVDHYKKKYHPHLAEFEIDPVFSISDIKEKIESRNT